MQFPLTKSDIRSKASQVIFDLDGTLVDTLPGIQASVHAAIASVLSEAPAPDLQAFIGPPVAKIFASMWPDLAPEKMERLVAEFSAHYLAAANLRINMFSEIKGLLL